MIDYSAEALVAAMHQRRRDYEVALLRWLQMKRDYPWSNEPEPEPPFWIMTVLYRDDIIREFNRTLDAKPAELVLDDKFMEQIYRLRRLQDEH